MKNFKDLLNRFYDKKQGNIMKTYFNIQNNENNLLTNLWDSIISLFRNKREMTTYRRNGRNSDSETGSDSTQNIRPRPLPWTVTKQYPQLTDDLKDKVINDENNLIDEEYWAYEESNDELLTMEDLFPKTHKLFRPTSYSMFEAALKINFCSESKAAQIELASSYFIEEILLSFGILISRDNYIYCYLHNCTLIDYSKEDIEQFGSREIVTLLLNLLDLNYYYLSICYEHTKEGNDYNLVRNFNKGKYVDTVYSIVNDILLAIHK